MKPMLLVTAVAVSFALAGCATEQQRVVQTQQVRAAATPFQGTKVSVAVGKFDNRSNFMRGIFTDNVDRLGSQAKTILVGHLQDSQRFSVLERENLEETKQEAGFKAQAQSIKGADYIVTGAVAEFGRKETGDQQLSGILGRGKAQIAYAKVTLNVVNTQTSEVVATASGAGEYELSTREVLGFGGTAGYDATLTGKVLDLAIREAVDKLSTSVQTGQLAPLRPR